MSEGTSSFWFLRSCRSLPFESELDLEFRFFDKWLLVKEALYNLLFKHDLTLDLLRLGTVSMIESIVICNISLIS